GCEASAFIVNGDKEELFLERVDKLIPTEEGLLLENIFGQRKVIKAKIKRLELVDHRILLERED
uniref:CooT n=1 Tax=Carboxydothermus hydrogenoformans (strain ATCC BAA-161 / DSM 6008 / Z-2901) TaxID=246194 RepID=UPI000F517967|nr:Chain A, CooT [Carboxydothermus hydrogenoformans Z-2901]6FAN_B Chain B, CooT [Carboxydothermus hydrogenoformans Z-2901]6FAN_C Chain C, CooT [Carboxydothermus hydrogenoformans Z-2901]6FAN_D Chain D, CooT [Carboxydothermus hydrogenoformans Z-2901]6FAN_E Chain E, CooT [Carboxydothermus hydrogenoformans Z-2901]6FAN_F Chain F, CooT [Carboxydothermus hydrogenoformans Z-2901]